jgi:hypothetical protein
MTCKRYWREGVVLAERNEPDPHRDTCIDCIREHAARDQMVRALPMVSAEAAVEATGDSHWQARVWQQIAQETVRPVRTPWRLWVSLTAPLVAACAAAMLWWVLRTSGPNEDGTTIAVRDRVRALQCKTPCDPELSFGLLKERSPKIEIFAGPVTMRASSARVGDRLRITARLGDDIRVYRADRLVVQCTAALASSSCTVSSQGIVVETSFTVAGEYQLAVIKNASVAPAGTLSSDLAAVIDAESEYELTSLSIR